MEEENLENVKESAYTFDTNCGDTEFLIDYNVKEMEDLNHQDIDCLISHIQQKMEVVEYTENYHFKLYILNNLSFQISKAIFQIHEGKFIRPDEYKYINGWASKM